MKSCPNCKFELKDSQSECHSCGTKLTPSVEDPSAGLEFVVTEAHDGSHELIGDTKPPEPEDDLGIETNADLMQGQPIEQDESPKSFTNNQIGTTYPPLPDQTPVEETPPVSNTPQPQSNIQKLTDEQVKNIKKNLYGKSSQYLNQDEKRDILNSNIEEQSNDKPENSFGNQPIVPPKKDKKAESTGSINKDINALNSTRKPKMANRSRGIAFFAKNLIQIKGEQDLHEGDELIINERHYVLKQKKISTKFTLSVLAPIAAVLIFFLGASFTTDTSGGMGSIVGVAIDNNGQPYKRGAEIRLPGLGKKYETNPQGFFKTDDIERGSYKIEYVVDGEVIKTDYATVVDGEVTTITLAGEKTKSSYSKATAQKKTTNSNQKPVQQVSQNITNSETQKVAEKPKETSSTTKEVVSKPKKASSTPSYARLKLNSNIINSKIKLDGKVIGAGNLTYSNLSPGQHNYSVSADGYESKSGTITLSKGKTTKLDVNLTPLAKQTKQETFAEQDFFYSGKNALEQNDLNLAISEFTEAIKLKPSYADAYAYRAAAYDRSGLTREASDDYLRAAEQYRFKGNISASSKAYNNAISANPKNVDALLGRGNLYLAKKEEIAAVADFDEVKRIDKRNVNAYIGLGKARFERGNYRQASKHFNDAKSLDSGNPIIYQYLMLSYMAMNDINKVKKTYDRFVQSSDQKALDKFHSDKKYTAIHRVVR